MDRRRKLPECVEVLDVSDLNEAVDLCLFAFMEYTKRYGFYNYKKGNLKESKYFKFFLDLTLKVCEFVYSIDSSAKLMNYEFAKICLDWFIALQETYKKMGRGKFYLSQITSEFAQEVFVEYIAREYENPVAYLEAMKPKINKLKKEDIGKEEYEENMKKIKFQKNREIKGLTEIIF